MWFVILMVVTLVVSVAAAVWPPAERPASTTRVRRPAGPESLEGVLFAQLVNGEITQRQYLAEMRKLAVRDDERHPLSVPPDA